MVKHFSFVEQLSNPQSSNRHGRQDQGKIREYGAAKQHYYREKDNQLTRGSQHKIHIIQFLVMIRNLKWQQRTTQKINQKMLKIRTDETKSK